MSTKVSAVSEKDFYEVHDKKFNKTIKTNNIKFLYGEGGRIAVVDTPTTETHILNSVLYAINRNNGKLYRKDGYEFVETGISIPAYSGSLPSGESIIYSYGYNFPVSYIVNETVIPIISFRNRSNYYRPVIREFNINNGTTTTIFDSAPANSDPTYSYWDCIKKINGSYYIFRYTSNNYLSSYMYKVTSSNALTMINLTMPSISKGSRCIVAGNNVFFLGDDSKVYKFNLSTNAFVDSGKTHNVNVSSYASYVTQMGAFGNGDALVSNTSLKKYYRMTSDGTVTELNAPINTSGVDENDKLLCSRNITVTENNTTTTLQTNLYTWEELQDDDVVLIVI